MWMQFAQIGSSVAGAVGGYFSAKANAENARRIQKQRNKLVRESNALAQDAITQQTLEERRQLINAGIDIQMQGQANVASIITQAAATGTAGNSVNSTVASARAKQARAEYQREMAMEALGRKETMQRSNAAMAATMQFDNSVYSDPSALGYGLSALGGALGALAKGDQSATPTSAISYSRSQTLSAYAAGFKVPSLAGLSSTSTIGTLL